MLLQVFPIPEIPYLNFIASCSSAFIWIWPSSASTQLNFNLNFEAEIALFPDNTATHPQTQPRTYPTNQESSKMEQDFKYFNWREILAKLSLNLILTPAQPQLNSISTKHNLNSHFWAWHYTAYLVFYFVRHGVCNRQLMAVEQVMEHLAHED